MFDLNFAVLFNFCFKISLVKSNPKAMGGGGGEEK